MELSSAQPLLSEVDFEYKDIPQMREKFAEIFPEILAQKFYYSELKIVTENTSNELTHATQLEQGVNPESYQKFLELINQQLMKLMGDHLSKFDATDAHLVNFDLRSLYILFMLAAKKLEAETDQKIIIQYMKSFSYLAGENTKANRTFQYLRDQSLKDQLKRNTSLAETHYLTDYLKESGIDLTDLDADGELDNTLVYLMSYLESV